MRLYIKFFALILSSFCLGCSNSDRIIVKINNPSDILRENEPVIIVREQLDLGITDLKMPVVRSNGRILPSQCDDIDNDGEWDELVFQVSLPPGQSEEYEVEWVEKSELPDFEKKTAVVYGKLLSDGNIHQLEKDGFDRYYLPRGGDNYPYQMDGPVWENDKVAYRHYMDGRNCRDVFGKLVPELVMGKVGIDEKGDIANNYSSENYWGKDILVVGNSLGIGGTAVLVNDSLVRAGVMRDSVNNIDSTYFEKIAEGPVRSVFRIRYKGWNVCGNMVDVEETITMYAGKYGYLDELLFNRLPEDARFVTGIATVNNMAKKHRKIVGNNLIMTTHDMQDVGRKSYLGMSLMTDKKCIERAFEVSSYRSDIKDTWCIAFKRNEDGRYWYYAFTGWKRSDSRFKNLGFYNECLKNETMFIANPLEVLVLNK